MKLSSQQTVKKPMADVCVAVSDFAQIEALLTDMGVEVTQVGGPKPPMPGARWRATFDWRDRNFDIEAELVSFDPSTGYAIESKTSGITCLGVVDLEPIDVNRTRLFVSFDLSATGIAPKILLQTLRVTAPSINRRLDKRLESLARRIERRA